MHNCTSLETFQTIWFGYLPQQWECKKIGTLFSERKTKVSDKDYQPLSVTKMGIVPQLETAVKTDAGDNRKLVCAGDFVINSRSDRKGSCGISESDGSVSLINIVLTPRNQWNRRYVHYLMRSQPFSEEFYRNGKGIVSDLWTTRYSEMKSILLPVPPRDEQDQIVKYLDWQLSKINKMISAKRKQIELLNEHLRYAVNNAVTKGLRNEELVNSGVYWIGKIPKSWEVIKIKWLFDEDNKRNDDGTEELLSFSRKKGLIPFSEASEKQPSASDLTKYRVVRPGQLLENRMQAWSGMFICVTRNGCVSPDYSVFNPSSERYVNVKFFEYVFRNPLQVEQFANASRGVGSGFNRLYTPAFGAIYTVYPTREEQDEIVDYLDNIQIKYREAIEKIEEEIECLHDMKNRLIFDVVTGKIDVRDIEIPEYEFVEEEADGDVDDVDGEDAEEQEE